MSTNLKNRFNPKGKRLPDASEIGQIKQASAAIIADVGKRRDGISDPSQINVEVLSFQSPVIRYKQTGSLCGACPMGEKGKQETRGMVEAGLRRIWPGLKFQNVTPPASPKPSTASGTASQKAGWIPPLFSFGVRK